MYVMYSLAAGRNCTCVKRGKSFPLYFMIAMKQVSLHTNNSAGIGTHQRSHNIMHCVSLDCQYSTARARGS